MFAKLFESDRCGQIVAMKDTADDGGAPELRLYFEPGGVFSVSCIKLEFNQADGEALRDAAFDKLTLPVAESMVRQVVDAAGKAGDPRAH